jgi:hypothetical protein
VKKWSSTYVPLPRSYLNRVYQNPVVSNFSMNSWIRLPGVPGGKKFLHRHFQQFREDSGDGEPLLPPLFL